VVPILRHQRKPRVNDGWKARTRTPSLSVGVICLKKAPAEASALRSPAPGWSLLLGITLLGRVIPRAASLIATSFVGCRRRVLSEGRASEGECQSQSKSRNKHFHDFTPLLLLGAAITPAGREMFRADCGKLRVSRTALPAARSI